MDRQLNAAVNLYLQMEGLSPSPKLFEELMRAWGGFTLTEDNDQEAESQGLSMDTYPFSSEPLKVSVYSAALHDDLISSHST
ncbi:MAG: hypothetical protein QXO55_05250 [Candidatus Korarchaeum sp.]